MLRSRRIRLQIESLESKTLLSAALPPVNPGSVATLVDQTTTLVHNYSRPRLESLESRSVLSPGDIALMHMSTDAFVTVPLFRLTLDIMGQPGHSDLLYTTSEYERGYAVGLGYQDDGVACYVFPSQTSGTTPLFRLYSPTGAHLYTTSEYERGYAVGLGYHDEGVACYVFPSQASGTTPLFRLADSRTGARLYTTSEVERIIAITRYDYLDDGVVGYVFSSQV